jgi:hypothetical protein
VLSFEAELVLDGRSLPRPVNYGLVRIVPPYFSLTTMTTFRPGARQSTLEARRC